jgi:hypothetical protein
MNFLVKEDIVVSGVVYTVKERIAEGGFGFVDLVVNQQTLQLFVVSSSSLLSFHNY